MPIHKDFEKKSTLERLKYSKGLKYFLDGFFESQKDIKFFIERCKKLEDEKGYVSENLFELDKNLNYKFSSGPFAEKIFKIIK